MKVIRTIAWLILLVILVAFIVMNWNMAPVNIWPLEDGYLHFNWPVGFIALIFFLLGWTPMYLFYRAEKWRLQRRITSLENTVRATSARPPLATSTQLEQEAERTLS